MFLSAFLTGLPGQTPPPTPNPPAAASLPATATNSPAALNTPTAGNSPPPVAAAVAKPPPTSGELQRAAIALQRAAIRRQAEDLGLWLMPLDAKPRLAIAETPDCDPLEQSLVNPLIEDAAKRQSLDPKLVRAVVEQESAFRPCAVSVSGAQGLMQLMPETGVELGVANPFDPKQNVDAGARYLKQLLDKYKGDLSLALGAYNAGPKTLENSGGVPSLQETRDYVDAVLAKAGLKPAQPAAPIAKPAEPTAPPAKPADSPAKSPAAPAKPADSPAKSPT